MIPEQIQKFIETFSRLPSLGPRLATRLAFYLANLDRVTLHVFATSLNNLKSLARCERCFFFRDEKEALCSFCRDVTRDKNCVALVEKETDVLAVERTGMYKGMYFVLGELPERGALEAPQRLRVNTLKKRIKEELGGSLEELIVAINPTTLGDFLMELIRQEFKDCAKKITRLGRGIPTGGEIEFADEETLKNALERRI